MELGQCMSEIDDFMIINFTLCIMENVNKKCKYCCLLLSLCCDLIFYAIYMLNTPYNILDSLCPYRPKHFSILSSALEMIGCICQAKSLGSMKR